MKPPKRIITCEIEDVTRHDFTDYDMQVNHHRVTVRKDHTGSLTVLRGRVFKDEWSHIRPAIENYAELEDNTSRNIPFIQAI